MKLNDRPTPETDAELKRYASGGEWDDFIHSEFARKMERERDYMIRSNNTLRMDMDGLAHEICQLQDALGCPCEVPEAQEKAMERVRDLIAAEGELGDAKERIERLEAECTRLNVLWHAAEERANVEKEEMIKICATITAHFPRAREICTTAEAVEWLVDRHKTATDALYKLEEIRTEKLAAKGLPDEASAVSAARVILQGKRIADESADESPDGQEENAGHLAAAEPGPK